MESKYSMLIVAACLVANVGRVQSAGLLEKSYDYVYGLGKSLAPNFMAILDCLEQEDPWLCTKQKAAKMLDTWEKENENQRESWGDAADAEVLSSARSHSELPSKLGTEIEASLTSLADVVQDGVARATARKHHEGGGIDTITISTSDKKKEKKKKTKPPKIHLIQAPMLHMKHAENKGRGFQQTGKSPVQSWVIGSEVEEEVGVEKKEGSGPEIRDANVVRESRGLAEEAWAMGEKAIDAVAEHVVENENSENGLENDKSSFEEQRGKKKKKKKAILKLLILGAVLKAKIATLLQILSFKLQVKFFIIALIGLGINLARFWLDLKKSHQPPQKVVYYEHAQHQHHYDHEEEHGWGPWSRSVDPEEILSDPDIATPNGPYSAYDRSAQVYHRPTFKHV